MHQPFILLALIAVSGYAGIMDIRTRMVTKHIIVASYILAAASNVNAVVAEYGGAADQSTQQPPSTPADQNGFYNAPLTYPAISKADIATAIRGEESPLMLAAHAGQYIMAGVLSSAGLVIWKSRMLAAGDAVIIPAFLFTLAPIAASPQMVAMYYVLAASSVLIASVTNNLRNNVHHRDRLYGPLWHRLYLMIFCYYGEYSVAKHAFVYGGNVRRDYDSEQFYSGSAKTWLMPGLPLLAGFAPAIVVVLEFMPVLH